MNFGPETTDVPIDVLRTAWVAIVPMIKHSFRSCNGGPDDGGPWCFTCEAIEALRPYQHLWVMA